ncbi:SusC/RagA family TonB-linked outer membrane protein [Bacteroides acidifaciens]|jgi:TonB-linked SusC/RagA family outer membrane protein|uniref:TonB-dependent receptor n=2 Tax=Bacteroides acidifaciens TaxID=85831 RepID=A0A4S2B244_9BACE|nr:TonB-dependent receptor [Bacteroides acidifaciens]MBF0729316.1 TonB-dependent receptor [Bacteroides acidifaciens]MBF0837138.1 TonB-dependent receptor [Bacteroides acidifaciens]NDO52812.1 TonB-dependent receptor [Bacteroides acidifaciens]TFU50337.1 TonB-dependent receptor [Bacteroides acidifaciens]TGY07905.1 TonB-dependent receptor [Bacteroides acidifaciens]
MKKHKYLFVACLSLFPVMAVAGNDTLHEIMEVPSATNINKNRLYKGKVVDDRTSEPLVGATVKVKGSTIGTITDIDGNFALDIPDNISPIVFEVSYMGYASKEAAPAKTTGFTIRLAEDSQTLEEVQIIAYGKQSKMSVTAAISSIDTKELLKSPSGSVANALSGAVTGLSSIQPSGQPGAENPSIYIRGTGSLSDELSKPLILVDGVERSFFQMDSHEIESITVLKDAASTAVFGVRGANGVVLVTTRRGVSGKPVISLNSSFGLTQALRNLKGVDSYTYATLYNEAQLSDNPSLTESQLGFSPFVIDMFRTNEDPIMFPNVDWNDYLFKNLAWQTQHNLTLSGGGERFRYFVSLGYLLQDGMLKQLGESYDPNYQYKRFNYRSNVDIDIAKSTLLKVNIGGHVGAKREPRTDELWRKVLWSTPFSSPGIVDGKLISNIYSNRYISIGERSCPLDYYYNYGYNVDTDNVLNLDLALEQKLDFITPGLSMNIKGAYNTNYNVKASRTPSGADSMCTPIYLGSIETPGMDFWDPRFDRTIVYQTDGVSGLHEQMSYGEEVGRGRNWYGEFSLNYSRSFGDHDVSALFLYNQSKKYYPETKIDGKVFYMDIPTAYVGYVGRMTYAYKKRYMVDLNAGYNGSENFAPDKRFGFFPAVSAGWILSEEKFMKKQKVIDFLKLRASYGIVGNDKMENARFLYMAGAWSGYNTVAKGQGSWQFGKDGGTGLLPDAKENTMGNPDVTWEKVAKQNYGIDLKMFDSRLSLTADVFFEKRKDILSTRNTLPAITDINLPKINLGKVNNHGYELSLGWNDRAGKVDYWLKANVSYAKNKIIYMDEVVPNEPYMAETGRSTGLTYGYIFDRFLQKDDFDADGNLKKDENGRQILPQMALGTPRPGDALFKDLNGDGVINGDDKTRFGYAERPDYVFGFLGGLKWKNFEFSMQWTAAMNASRILDGEYRNAFGSTNSRMLLKFLADERWTEENPNSRFPRLTFMNKSHYLQTSDLWLMNGSYLRLKTAEISYTLPQKDFLKKVGIESVRFYCNGYNLLTLFSDLNDIDIDPEGVTDGGNNNYPNIRIYNFGVNISF